MPVAEDWTLIREVTMTRLCRLAGVDEHPVGCALFDEPLYLYPGEVLRTYASTKRGVVRFRVEVDGELKRTVAATGGSET